MICKLLGFFFPKKETYNATREKMCWTCTVYYWTQFNHVYLWSSLFMVVFVGLCNNNSNKKIECSRMALNLLWVVYILLLRKQTKLYGRDCRSPTTSRAKVGSSAGINCSPSIGSTADWQDKDQAHFTRLSRAQSLHWSIAKVHPCR